jgi:toxin ParE1/3/4
MILRNPRVTAAIEECARHISLDSLDAALRFYDMAESTFAKLEASPGIGRPYNAADQRLAGLRIWSLDGFPSYLIFYRGIPEGVEVLWLIHGARDINAVLGAD